MAAATKGTTKRKPRKPLATRLGKSVVVSMNRKAYGDEYEFDHPISRREAEIAFNWYSLNVVDYKSAASFLYTYLENSGRSDVDIIKKIPDQRVFGFGCIGCWIARMRSIGIEFADNEYFDDLFERQVRNIISAHERLQLEDNPTAPKKFKRPPSAERSPAEKKFDAYLEFLNGVFDDLEAGKKIDIVRLINEEKLDQPYVIDMLQEIDEYSKSLAKAIEEPDEWESKKINFEKMKKQMASFSTASYDIQKLIETSKARAPKASGEPKVRKPRKKKPVSAEKRVSRMKYQVELPEMNLKSVDPVKLLEAQELWVYNSKYSMLTVYRARNENGLDVKGTTIINFDEDRSVSKKIGRRAAEITNEVITSGKVPLRKLMDTIKSNPMKPNGRINENTLMLRVG